MNEEKISSDRLTLIEIIAGIIFFSLVWQAVLIWFVTDKLGVSLGLWCGSVLATFMVWNMHSSLVLAFDMGEGAGVILQRRMLIRYGVVVLGFGLMAVSGFINPLAGFAGIMTLKLSAYIQPITHRIIIRVRR